MRPFELYLPVSDQNGVLGENRDLESCNKTGAANDHDAILFWLRKYALQPTAAYKYRNEAERLLMWANFHKRKALSSLTVLDCLEYINVFLRDPQPRRIWVMERPFKRDDPHWRPFRGPLSYRSREIALTTLKNLFRSLTEVGYLGFNSFAEVRQAKQEMTETQSIGPSQTRTHRVQIERSLSWDEWCFVQRCLLRLPNNKPATHRIRFIVYFAYGTGLRRAELASACIGDISEKFAGAELGMITALNIRGRGGELRQIPLCPSLLNVLEDYLEFRGLGRNPERCPPDTPLIPALEDNRDKAMRKAEAKTLINEGGASGKGAVPRQKCGFRGR
ncbi:hypothetical protein PQQ96_37705 [Paraburkholderia sediminicola]|uniref:tyrosine-type recombinase/integrase n=1 Tax=Paraburkholderia sediminicola TaxID=458836 RepID=UPI0038B7332A